MDQGADYDADIRERVDAMVSGWVEPHADRATVERSDPLGETCWAIHPRSAKASPLWVAGSSAWVLTVGFGRSHSCIELGFSAKVTADDALSELDGIGRSVIAGRLVEWRRGRHASRWRLTLPDGTVTRGASHWILLLPWRATTEEHFSAYW